MLIDRNGNDVEKAERRALANSRVYRGAKSFPRSVKMISVRFFIPDHVMALASNFAMIYEHIYEVAANSMALSFLKVNVLFYYINC